MKKISYLPTPQKLCPIPIESRPGSPTILMPPAQAEQVHVRLTIFYQHLTLSRWPCTEKLQLHEGKHTGLPTGVCFPAGSSFTAQLFWNKYFYDLHKKKNGVHILISLVF